MAKPQQLPTVAEPDDAEIDAFVEQQADDEKAWDPPVDVPATERADQLELPIEKE